MPCSTLTELICLASDGRMLCFGRRGPISLPVLEPGVTYTHISAGVGHIALLTSRGQATLCWVYEDGIDVHDLALPTAPPG